MVGTRYARVNSLYEGYWSTYRAHADCLRLHQWIGRELCSGEWAMGDLKDAVREHYREAPTLLGEWAAIRRARRVEQVGRPR